VAAGHSNSDHHSPGIVLAPLAVALSKRLVSVAGSSPATEFFVGLVQPPSWTTSLAVAGPRRRESGGALRWQIGGRVRRRECRHQCDGARASNGNGNWNQRGSNLLSVGT
jgi:hypothetical protein